MAKENSILKEVESFGFQEEWNRFKERHGLFFERFHHLGSTLDKIFIRELSGPEPVDKVVFYLGRVCCEDFMEILLLCSNGYGIGGLKLLRGMYERTVIQ
ncbi:hypothetical protein MYX78_04830 [Acidobacteria bacterium AH-259-G07]|nr:hypothetical protein [Acidobacteria bacterium AH-259-G07]